MAGSFFYYNTAVHSATRDEVWRTEVFFSVYSGTQFRLWERYRTKTQYLHEMNDQKKGGGQEETKKNLTERE